MKHTARCLISILLALALVLSLIPAALAAGDSITDTPENHNCPSFQFTDMPKPGHWAHEGIDFAVSRGLFNGMSDSTFVPNASMTRGMLVTVLWRMVGQPHPSGLNPFADVREQYFAVPVMWAAENGIVNGVGNNKFDPNGNITREQLASILYRYAQMSGINTAARADLSGFPDADKVSSWAKESMAWAVASGLISGSSEGGVVKLLPRGNATRAQVASILQRFITPLLDSTVGTPPPADLSLGEIIGDPVVFYGKPSDIQAALDSALTGTGIAFTDVEGADPASVSSAIENGAGLLLVTLDDAAKAQQIVDLAKAANVPLVFFDCTVPESVIASYDRCILLNMTDEQIGRTLGRYIGSFLGYNFDAVDRDSYQNQVITYVMLMDDGSDPVAASCASYAVEAANVVLACDFGRRAMCFQDDWAERYAIPAPEGGWTKESARQVMLEILKEHDDASGDPVEAIFVNDAAAVAGVAQALIESGYNTIPNWFIPVFTVGCSDEIRELLYQGVLNFSAVDNSTSMAQAICRMIHNASRDIPVFGGIHVDMNGTRQAILFNILTGE